MFGFIRPVKSELRIREVERFQAMYCGLCHEIKRKYGRIQTFFLSYDMTFLALVLEAISPDTPKLISCRCDASPIRKKYVAQSSDALAYTADFSVLLTGYKIQDSIQDEHGYKRCAAKLLHQATSRVQQTVQQKYPILNQTIQTYLQKLCDLEKENIPSLDKPADTFAQILSAAVPDSLDNQTIRILRQMFYHLGRWIYLIDACNDLQEDFTTGNYNPLRARFALKTPDLKPIEEQLTCTLQRSLLDIHTAYQLLPIYRDEGLLENIIDLGLPLITRQVIDGTYQKNNGGYQKHGSL